MESRAKLLGHPIHQMLIPFPLGLLGASVIFDIIHMARGGNWSLAAYYMIALGIITGLLATVFGLIDWTAIPSGTRAKATDCGTRSATSSCWCFFPPAGESGARIR